MAIFPWLFVVAISNIEVHGSPEDMRQGIPHLYCYHNKRIYMMGQRFPSGDGCNTCTCNGYNRVACTEIACLPRPPNTDLCDLPSETGRCRAYIPSWYYDSGEGRCKSFIYGGCGGNANRFATKGACQQRCGKDLCDLPSETGRCRAYIPSWYYDSGEERCKTFIYGGCGGNANRFATKEACEQRCGKEICKLPEESGPCDGFFPRWYYDYGERKCKQFIYGGCDGNANRFDTHAECQSRCGSEPVCPTGEPLPGRTCGGLLPGNQCPRGYTCVGELVPVDGPGVCCPVQQEPVCPTGEPLPGRTCGGLLPGNQCPRGYTCVGELVPVDGPGVCCPEQPEPVCPTGEPLPGRTCGGLLPGNQCPRGYTCVGELVPVDGPGVCCPIQQEPVCLTGEPLPGRTCGGLLPGNQCPRGYTCVGELVPVDGPGVCCPEQPEPVCPTGEPLPGRTCGGLLPGNQCPRGYTCVGELVPVDGPGVCCPEQPATPHQLCPRLNPLVDVQCIRFEQCPQEGCPGHEECCPTYCGTACRVLRPPCGGNQPPLRDSFGRQLFCGRGPNRVDCPRGHYCSIDPADRYAVCCPYL